MEDWIRPGYPKSEEVAKVVDGIVQLLHPKQIYLYNQRVNAKGETTGFKLCIIAQLANKTTAERDIYLHVDSEIPFDVLLYTPAEWAQLCDSPDSFASKIYLTGMVVYG